MIKSCKKPPVYFPTVTGSICSFNSQYADLPLKSCVVDFEDETGIDSLDFSATGKNLWSGEGMLHSFQKFNLSEFTYDDETLSYFAPTMRGGKIFISDVFKPNTQYTLILVGKKNGSDLSTNLRVVYTDGSYTNLNFSSTPATEKQTLIYKSRANNTIKDIRGLNGSDTTTLYYNECGLFEGVKTVDDFVPFGNNKLFSFGKTIQNGSLNVLTGELTNNDTTPPEVINLGGIKLLTQEGVNNIFADCGDTTLEYLKAGR